MGMSAAQARLLSITTRLTNNEFRSQTITNSKLRLADKSAEASQEYMDALNSQKLVYNYYNDNGESEQLSLTPGLIYTYSPLKNQYALINSSGKMLVSAKDAEKFEQSDNLIEFLGKYGLVKNISAYEKYKEDNAKYKQDHANWETEHKDWETKHKDWEIAYQKYQDSLNQKDLYAIFSSAVGTSSTADDSGASYCYYSALNGNAACYLHLLNELLDFDGTSSVSHTYEASNGKNVTTNAATGGMWNQQTSDGTNANDIMKQVSEAINEQNSDGTFCRECDGDDDLSIEGKQNILKIAKDSGRTPSELELEILILKSDYVDNGDGTYSKKSLKQKAIDMYYIIQNKLVTDKDEMKQMLINFTDGDLQKLTLDPPGDEPKEPVEPREPVAPLYETILNDKDKAQWYVNLWHMMNGSDTANLVKTTEYKYQNSDNSGDVNNETIFSVENAYRNPQTKNYAIFDDNLINNADWLQFALEHGIVTLAKAEFFDPSEDSGKTPELTSTAITWKSTIFSNASEFIYIDDETAIAIAEVKYKNKINEIENKDKKFDQDLKKLDTEHTALQTEYESIKEAMNKNIERSFKAFS